MLIRPRPPERLLGQDGFDTIRPFEPAPEMEAWARAAFISEDAELLNEEHAHLREATVGFMWTSVPNARGGNGVVGQAEIPSIQGGKWARARFFQQVEEWFGLVPDFMITLDAGFADPNTQAFSKNPLHDWASHAADAFRYFAVAIAEPRPDDPPVNTPNDRYDRRRRRERTETTQGTGWAQWPSRAGPPRATCVAP